MELETLKKLQEIGVDLSDGYAAEMRDFADYIVCGKGGCRGWSPRKIKQNLPKEVIKGRALVSPAQVGMYKYLLETRGKEWMEKNHPDMLKLVAPPSTL